MSENLIIRYLTGELNEEDEQKLLEWVQRDESNKRYFAQVKNSWVSAKVISSNTITDIKKEAELFNYRKILLKDSKKQIYRIKTVGREKRSLWSSVLKVAAVVVFIYSIGLTTYTYLLPQKDRFNEIVTRNGEKSQVILSDGTKVWLNSNSKLRYPAHLEKGKVNFYLDGEAFFDVNKIPGREVIVNTSDLKINVIGTAFNIKSYSEDGITETTLVRGKITIDSQLKKLKQVVVLQPNQQATYIASNEQLLVKDAENQPEDIQIEINEENVSNQNLLKKEPKSKMVVTEKVETQLFTSWKDGKLVFKSERFEDLATRMERWFDVNIEIETEQLKNSRYTGTFEKESIEQALKALSLSLPFTYNIDQNNIIIKPM